MSTLDEYENDGLFKAMCVGASGTGKTGSMTSLVKAGYKLRIYDFDNGLEALRNHCRAEDLDLSSIEFEQFRDKMKMTSTGPRVKGSPKAYSDALTYLEKWTDGSDPAEWGPEYVCVIDSLTAVGRAAFQWAKHMNHTCKDPRQWYKTAQELCEDLVANLTDSEFKTNVLIHTHIEITENKDGSIKHYPSAIGKALGPKIPKYFNTMLLYESSGMGKSVKKKIKTLPTAMMDVKNPSPMTISDEYSIETGLAEICKKLIGE